MIAVVDSAQGKARLPWGFWVACGLAVIGGITPIVLAGTSGRVNGVIFPFWFAALAMAGCALFQHRGRVPATVLYLVGALAVVYGILGMVSVLVDMTVQTPCPAALAQCPPGFARLLTSRETTGIDYATGLGILAMMFGFAGMVANYRFHRRRQPVQAPPPMRRMPPQPAHQPEPPAPDQDAPTTTEGASE